ncbi:hypothetical protein Dxin01_04296 [Deinococcus xinjiangensis]|uniref:Uncharacterized protein n=1 Tax=Deinococcus xinjiangensis TaxID=457454 RepID=A0ABP9VID0_9DEIO
MINIKGAMERRGFRLTWLNRGITTAFVELPD